MISFYFRLSALLILLFIVCGFGLTALGSTQPIHPALRGFVEGCEGIEQPCWYGIVPGVTTIDDAVMIIRNREQNMSLNDQVYHYFNISADNCTVEMSLPDFMMMDCVGNSMTVGDLMTLWDIPDQLVMACEKIVFVYQAEVTWGFSVYGSAQSLYPSPYDFVSDIFVTRAVFYNESPWHGFQLFWNYPPSDINGVFPYGCIPPRSLQPVE